MSISDLETCEKLGVPASLDYPKMFVGVDTARAADYDICVREHDPYSKLANIAERAYEEQTVRLKEVAMWPDERKIVINVKKRTNLMFNFKN